MNNPMTPIPTEKRNTAVNRLLRYLAQHVYSITVGVMCIVHMGLLVIMLISNVWPLVYMNVLSVVVYSFCYILCRTGNIKPVYYSVILEVTVYAIVSTHFIGIHTGSYCFLFSIVPIIIYFGSHLYQGSKRWGIVAMLTVNFALYIALYIAFANATSPYELHPVIEPILTIFSMFAMVFSTVFYNTIYIYTSENEVISLEQKNRELSADAQEDALTNLLNRRGFLPMLENLMKNRSTSRFCVAFCDLDDFKRVNDSYGHDGGDEVLKHTTLMIREELPGCDICRWGGEEFVILLRDLTMAEAREKVDSLRKSIATTPTVFFNKQIFITITIGLEENKSFYGKPEEIIKVADARMYYGKQHGKNVLIYEDLEDGRLEPPIAE